MALTKDVLVEFIKHLPGQHNQRLHAGSHLESSVTRADIDNDIAAGENLKSLMSRESIKALELYIATKEDVRMHSMTRYPRPGALEEYKQRLKDLDEDPNFLAGVDANNKFRQAANTADRYYRGVAADRVKDLIKSGSVNPYAAQEYVPYYGKIMTKDTSMTLDPKTAQKFGPFTLIIDAKQARQHGAYPVDYTTRDRDDIDDIFVNFDELEVRADKDMPNSAILGVMTPDGNILSLKKK